VVFILVMTELPPMLKAAMDRAILDHPDWSPADFMRELGAAVADQATRDAIERQWLRVSIEQARREGPTIPLEDVRQHVRGRLAARAAATTSHDP
jgi:hypothetical protein